MTNRADRERAALFLFHQPDAPRVRVWVEAGEPKESTVDFGSTSAVCRLAAAFAAVRAEARKAAIEEAVEAGRVAAAKFIRVNQVSMPERYGALEVVDAIRALKETL